MAKKKKFSTHMEKEIHEIPDVVLRIIQNYAPVFCERILPDVNELAKLFYECDTVHIAACGTAYHAGLVIGKLMEEHCKIRTKVYIASEFNPLVKSNDIAIVVSQSGETADTVSAMKRMKEYNIPIVALCNVENSTIAKTADWVIPTRAGQEVSVASTKAFIAQVLCGVILVNNIFYSKYGRLLYTKSELLNIPLQATKLLSRKREIKQLAKLHRKTQRIFFLGSGMDAFLAYESALKVKEITYNHCEGYAALEFRHGTMALVDDKTLCVGINTSQEKNDKLNNLMNDVKSRGSKIWNIDLFESGNNLSFVVGAIPSFFFALYLSKEKGNNTDKPRNLTKAVTIE
ncbi:MAG: SIS domain-containing protein [Firmicutes bacterium]|nr:SIS domain-containing protein [Bacillota bacterium]